MITKQTPPEPDALDRQFQKQRRTARRRTFAAVASVVAMILALTALILSVNRGDQPAVPVDSVDTVVSHDYLDIATGERSPVAADLTGARLPVVSPDGENIVFGTCCTGADTIYVADLAGASERIDLIPGEMNGYAPTWIDDRTVLFQRRDADTIGIGDLYSVDIVTGELTMVLDLPDLKNEVSWVVRSDISPDGSTVLYHLPRGEGENVRYDLWISPLAGGEPTMLRRDAGYAQFAADGSIVFLDHAVPYQGDEIWVMEGDGDEARMLVSDSALTWPQVSPDGTRVVYVNEGQVEIADIATGDVTAMSADSEEAAAWFGNDRLII